MNAMTASLSSPPQAPFATPHATRLLAGVGGTRLTRDHTSHRVRA